MRGMEPPMTRLHAIKYWEKWGKRDRGSLTEHSEALLLPGDVLDLDHVVIESIFADGSDPLLGGSPHVSLSDPRVF